MANLASRLSTFAMRVNRLERSWMPAAGKAVIVCLLASLTSRITRIDYKDQGVAEFARQHELSRSSRPQLRKSAMRTVDGLWSVIGRLVDLFTPQECANYFAAAGYDAG